MITNYDIKLKKDRHKTLKKNPNFFCYEDSIQNRDVLNKIYNKHKPSIIIHLAAQAGVRYSIENPQPYVDSNLIGTFEILEMARRFNPEHLLIASTSSVYGNSKKIPFEENQKSDNPISFYAATKKSNELMAHSYSHIFNIPITIFRFFTVYGPWGRPDMALFKFTKGILSDEPIDIYNYGNMKRDFTNVYDLVEAINLLIKVIPPTPQERNFQVSYDSISDTAPYRIVNIGNSKAYSLLVYIEILEKYLGKKAKKNFVGLQDGDIKNTLSNTNLLIKLIGKRPGRSLEDGIKEFVDWYKSYYSIP